MKVRFWLGLTMAGALGACAFFYFFGFHFLNPGNIAWLLSGDPFTFFYGSQFFSAEPWVWPLGQIKSYSFPEGTSIVYTDSIPFIALIWKLLGLGRVTPAQYHGGWILICFLLQGAIGFWWVARSTKSVFWGLLASVVLVTLPIFLNRGFAETRHYSLMGQFLVLWACALFVDEANGPVSRRHQWVWVSLFFLSLAIHFYFSVMIGVLWVGVSRIRHPGWIAVGAVFWAYLLGYFTIPLGNSVAGGFGIYAMNVAAPWMHRPDLFQVEGWTHWGMGVSFSLLIVLLISLPRIRNLEIPRWSLSLIWLTCLALSFRIGFFTALLTEWVTIPLYFGLWFWLLRTHLRNPVVRLLGALGILISLLVAGRIVRATGRFFWPIEYLAIFWVFTQAGSVANSRRFGGLIALAILGIQGFSLQNQWQTIRQYNQEISKSLDSQNSGYFLDASDDFWTSKLARFDHISFYDPRNVSPVPWAGLAWREKKTIGPMLAARASGDFRREEQTKLKSAILTNHFPPRTLVLVGDSSFWTLIQESCGADPTSCSSFEWGEHDQFRYLLPIALPEN